MLSFCRAFAFSAFIRKPSASLLQSARIAPSRESNLDSCRLMSLGSYRPENGRAILADSKRSLRPYGPPFSPERETCCMLSICRAFAFLAFIRKPSASLSLLQSARIAPSRESNLDSCQPMSLGSYRPANLLIRTDSKQRLRPFDMCPDRPLYFFELSGESEVVLWGKILFGTVYGNT